MQYAESLVYLFGGVYTLHCLLATELPIYHNVFLIFWRKFYTRSLALISSSYIFGLKQLIGGQSIQ